MHRVSNVPIEMTTRCNLRCRHCLDGDPERGASRRDIDPTLLSCLLSQPPGGTGVVPA